MLDILTGRAVRMAAQAAVLTAVVGGTVAYAHTGTDITLVLDGTARTVQSDASDVAGLLADEGIALSPRDLVAPDPGTPIRDGQQVVVRYARPFALTVDGVPRRYWTTELTVDAALRSLGVRTDGARLSASRSQPLGRRGAAVTVSTPKQVTVVGDGRTRDVTSTAVTVSDLLGEVGLVPRSQDQMSVLPATPVVPGLVVALTRIDRRQLRVEEPVAAPEVRQPSGQLPAGSRQVVSQGRPGRRTSIYQVVLADGRQVARSLVSSVLSISPVSSVVRIGTAPSDRPDGGQPSGGSGSAVAGADGLNWAALARCESGGNPRAVNPAGYYGLFQFSPGTWRAVGGSGLPSSASSSEQLYRAKLLYKRSGASQWGCGRHLHD